jgi:site-specific recombinase XerD
MASIFRRKRKLRLPNGKTVLRESKCWYVEYRDTNGIARRVKGYTDKSATLQKAAQLERDAARAQAGLTDKYGEQQKRPLSEHLEDFRTWLAVGNTDHYVSVTCSRIDRIFRGCGFHYWNDISASRIKHYLSGLDVSPKTFNYYVTAVKQICRWLVRDGRADKSPVEHLDRVRLAEDEFRRALSSDEVCRLLETTEKAPVRFGMSGHERAVLYLLTIETGLRIRELQSLNISSFDLENCVVGVRSEFCKNRKKAAQLVKYERAAQFRQFFSGKTPDVRAFNMPSSYRTAKMLQADLEDTGIPYVDDAGRKADFHCLRHTLATALDRTGASLKERMAIMRHSDRSNLTLGTYTHVRSYDLRRAIENLPDYPWPGTRAKAVSAATGTDGEPFTEEWTGKWTGKWTGNACFESTQLSAEGKELVSRRGASKNIAQTHNSLNMAGLDKNKDQLSSPDSRSKANGPGRIRTYDQWIMSPLLCR